MASPLDTLPPGFQVDLPSDPVAALPEGFVVDAQPAERPGLGERFRINAEQALMEGTLTGKYIADAKSGEAARMRADAAYREMDRRTYPQDFPSDFEVTPDPAASMNRLPLTDRATIRQADDAALLALANEEQAKADAAAAQFSAEEKARRAEYEALPPADRPSEYLAAGAGQLAGSLPTPENLVPVGRANTVLKTLIEGAAMNAGTSAVVEPAIQRENIRRGRQEAPDVAGGAIAVGVSGLLGGVLNVTPEMASAIGGRIARFLGKKETEVTVEDVARATKADPETQALLRSAGATDEQIAAMTDPVAMAERVRARQQADAAAAETGARPLEPTPTPDERAAQARQQAADAKAQAKSVRQAPDQLTPDQLAEARAAGEQPPAPRAPEVIAVGRPVEGETTARPAGAADTGTDAGVARARGDDIAERIGEDPAVLVETQLAVPRETYDALPRDAKERLVAAAQRQRTAEAPAPARATTDAALGEGERPYTPASRPQDRGAGEAGRGRAPTDTEIETSGQPYARAASGIADRPTRMDDSSGLDFTTRDPATGRPVDERAAMFERRATEQAYQERMQTVDDLIRDWNAREQARAGKGDPDAEARRQYEGGTGKNFSNKAQAADAEGRFATDGFGFVRSDKGGPIKFADQKQAAKWILNVGHKGSPDQIFEIHNHPSGKGFTVRERGRTENTGGRGQDAGNDAGGSGPASTVEEAAAPRALPARQKPREGGESAGTTGQDTGAARAPDGEAFGRNSEGGDDGRKSDSDAGQAEPKRPAGEVLGSVGEDDPSPAGAAGRNAERRVREPDDRGRPAGIREDAGAAGRDDADTAGNREGAGDASAAGREGAADRAPDAAGQGRGGVKLTSGVDPTDLIRPIAAALKREVSAAAKDLGQTRAMLKASTSYSTIARFMKNLGAKIAYSNRGVMWMIRDRYDGKAKEAISWLADQLATDPGSGRVVKQPYEDAVNQHAHGWMNRMGNMVGKDNLGNAKLGEEVGDVLAGRGGRASAEARAIAKRIRGLLDEAHKYLKDAGVEVGYRPDYFPRQVDTDAVIKDAAGFEADAVRLYRKMGLSQKEAAEAAAHWREREMGLGEAQFKMSGPLSDFTKGRTLPPEADQIMARWYKRDAFESLSGYFRQAARLGEFTRRFGKHGRKIDEALDTMRREGVHENDIALLRESVDSSLGLLNAGVKTGTAAVTSWVQTIGILRALPRAVWSSVAEPLSYGVRTGNAADGLKGFALAIQEVFGGKSLDDVRDVAEHLGIIGDAMTHMLLAGQFGGGQASRLNNAILARFFTRSGLQPLTEAQRLAGVRIGQDFIARLLRDASGGAKEKSAKILLRDLGIGDADIPKLSKWMNKAGGAPKVADLMGDSAEAQAYSAALLRFVDESIQNPKAVDRPILANHPVGRLAYGIMSFMFAYTRNVTLRVGNQAYLAATEKGLTAADRARLAVGPGLALAVLAAAQTVVAKLRDELTNPDEAKERPIELSVIQYASRAGAFGNLDPIVNGVLGAKYERDLTGMIAGPYVGQYLQDAQKMVGLLPEPIGKNSPNTNTAEWNAARAAYNMLAVPTIAAGLALAPGGPVLSKGYGALIASPAGPIGGQAWTAPLSPQASSDFASAVAGDRPARWKKGGGSNPFAGSGGRNPFKK